MKLIPLAPTQLPEHDGPRWGLIASAVLHGLVALALLSFAVRPPMGSAEPSYDLVFQGPSGGSPSPSTDTARAQPLPPSQPADVAPPPDAVEGIPAPTPLTTPDPAATGSPPPPAEAAPPPTAPPLVTPPVTAPPLPSPAPAAPQAAVGAPPPPMADASPDEAASLPLPVPAQAPPRVEAPAVRLEQPPSDAAPTDAAPIMPEPPPPLPAEPQPRTTARVAPRATPRPVRPSLGTLDNPMDLSLAPSAPRPAARGSVASRSIDLSPPAERRGPVASDPYAQIRAANASADWNRGLLQYWLQHRYYPEQAAADGEEGEVTVQLTVNRSGRVENVEVLSRSGSTFLDMAAVGTWRGAQLPPFTNEMREDRITFPVPIHYYLIRH